jgi:hypothetical protein
VAGTKDITNGQKAGSGKPYSKISAGASCLDLKIPSTQTNAGIAIVPTTKAANRRE